MINEFNPINIESNQGYINDIKDECQRLSIEQIKQMVVSELTGKDIK